jgi:general secretion pathway protein C
MRGLQDMSFSPLYLVAVNLVLLALAAYSASSIVGTALAARLMPPLEVELSDPPPPIPQVAAKPASYYASIHKRDIFNSAKPEVAPPPEAAPQITALKLKLWGVALHEGEDSYCIIQDESNRSREQSLYRVNEEVEGTGARVKAVEWDRVILTRNGKDEILELKPAEGDTRTASLGRGSGDNSPLRGRSRGGAMQRQIPDEHIQATGENEYLIDRSEVDNALENMSQLFTQIRAVPHFEGGESTGFRLFAIRSGSLFDKIGLKNGDIIQKINGNPMNDPSKAMQLLDELRNESSLSVEVIRNRQPQTLSYQFR